MNRLLAPVIASVALALVPAAASAATVTLTGSTLTYIADAQETNDLTISLAGDVYTVNEQGNSPGQGGIAVKNGGGCQVAGGGQGGQTTTATCPAAGITLLNVETGDQGDNVKILAATSARIVGGDGNDTLTGGDAKDQLIGDAGTDTLTGGGGDDLLSGSASDDDLAGGAGNDTLSGDEQNDRLSGDEGDDVLNGGAGGDTLSGGAGTDTADYSARSNALTVTIDGQPGDGEQGENDNVQVDVENVTGGGGADTLVGSDAANMLNGLAGDDVLKGLGGADVMTGGPGRDRVTYEGAATAVSVYLDNQSLIGAAGEGDRAFDVEDATGGNGADFLAGNSGANLLQGGPGDDHLLGGGGPDTLDGGDGNDAIQSIDHVVDTVACGNGTDGVLADKTDVLTGCETTDLGFPVQVLSRKLKMRAGKVAVSLVCSRFSFSGCGDPMKLSAGRTRLASKAHYHLRAGQKATLRLRVSGTGRALVLRKRRLRATLTLVVKDATQQSLTYRKTLPLSI